MNSLTEPKFIKRELNDRLLLLIDGLFQPQFVTLFDHFLKTLPFSLADYDREDSRHLLHWIHEFALESITAHPLVSLVFSRISAATKNIAQDCRSNLKRIHCNASLYGDMQLPHYDITPGTTWLYYSNPVWDPSWMGETIFYDLDREPVYAVFPTPGRVVVFDADILHRSGVPSRECSEARRSLVFKFSHI
jgi:hypothetical protein